MENLKKQFQKIISNKHIKQMLIHIKEGKAKIFQIKINLFRKENNQGEKNDSIKIFVIIFQIYVR